MKYEMELPYKYALCVSIKAMKYRIELLVFLFKFLM
jgi:hypothetical protein